MRAYLSAFVSATMVVVIAAWPGYSVSAEVFENTHKCDELAAHPDDPRRFAVGVEEDKLIPGLAIKACQEAVAEHPDTPRFQFQLGRVLLMGKDYDGAGAALAQAAKADYAPAYAYLADMYRFGYLGEEEQETAVQYYKLAITGGFEPAQEALRSMTEEEPDASPPAEAAASDQSPPEHPQAQKPDLQAGRTTEMIDREEHPLRHAETFDPSHFSEKRILSSDIEQVQFTKKSFTFRCPYCQRTKRLSREGLGWNRFGWNA